MTLPAPALPPLPAHLWPRPLREECRNCRAWDRRDATGAGWCSLTQDPAWSDDGCNDFAWRAGLAEEE